MKNYRIGIEAQRLFRKKKHGMDIVALETIRSLTTHFPDCTYVVFVKRDVDAQILPPMPNLEVVVTGALPYPIWEQWTLPRLCKKHRVDLLHATSNTAPLFSPVPLVVTVHDIIYLEKNPLMGGSAYQRFGNLYRAWNVPRVMRKAAKIITVSDYEKDRMDAYFKMPATQSKIVRVYNGVGAHFRPIAHDAIPKSWLQNKQLPEQFMLFLGNTDPKKNLDNVLRAMKILHHNQQLLMPLVMPDFGKEALVQLLKQLDALELLPHIHLTGYLPNAELPYLYNLAALFLYPSRRESFGIPPLEAMACGTPVISSNTSSMPEIGGDAALYITPENPQTIADAIVEILKNKELQAELVKKGLERAALFTWRHTAEGVYDCYQEVLK